MLNSSADSLLLSKTGLCLLACARSALLDQFNPLTA
jgi:hypothetical protein